MAHVPSPNRPSGSCWLPGLHLLLFLLAVCESVGGGLVKHPHVLPEIRSLSRQPRYAQQKSIELPPDIALGHSNNYTEAGRWSHWSGNSECSRTCGGGVSHQIRRCHDVRSDGSLACIGPSRRFFSCNIQDCPEGSTDFRAEQCSRFNGLLFDNKRYEWVPYFKAPDKCELNCQPKGEHFYYRHARKVIDGTRCDADSTNICVDGNCVPVGCDLMLGSNAKEDKCRECGGDGSRCHTVRENFDQDDLKVGYNDIVLIPAGATSIYVQEREATNNYLAIRNQNGKYYLNGNWRIDFPRDLHFAGTTWYYERRIHGQVAPESLRALGPLTEPIYIVLLYQESNTGVTYEYSVPRDIAPTHPPHHTDPHQQPHDPHHTQQQPETYSWVYGNYGECSQSCGGGQQARAVSCAKTSTFEVVPEYLCDVNTKPGNERACNTHHCPPSWHVGEWEECSETCGGGVQFRIVYCERTVNGHSPTVVPHENCLRQTGPRPQNIRKCNEHIQCPDWYPGPWSLCDRICGEGEQTRVLTCQRTVNDKIELFPDSACEKEKPSAKQNCTNQPCEGVDWIVSEWTGCDACSLLLESRTAKCSTQGGNVYPHEICDTRRIPGLRRDCPDSPPCEFMWYTTQWSECSIKCGDGVQTRHVFCATTNEEQIRVVPDSRCDPTKKYESSQNCSGPPCEGSWFTGPWNRCTAPCGGGHKTRKVLCLVDEDVVETKLCDPSLKPLFKEACNQHSCDEDEILTVGGCKDSKHGCCPDGVTAAGPDYKGCPTPPTTIGGCSGSEFGCCLDEVTPALGPFRKGCPNVTKCEETKFKCCPDGITPAKGLKNLGCPIPKTCAQTKYGCCPDGITNATGPSFAGCDFISSTACNETEFGCCPDNFTVALDNDGGGCPVSKPEEDSDDLDVTPEQLEGSGLFCSETEHGCCEDGISVASGPDYLGCENSTVISDVKITCEDSPFGCCADGISIAEGPEGSGCEMATDMPLECINSIHGCCPDGSTPAKGPDHEGCPELLSTVPSELDNATDIIIISDDFDTTMFDNETTSEPGNETTSEPEITIVPDLETVAPVNCSQTEFGCCQDGVTAALGGDYSGCPVVPTGACLETTFGCCPDGVTPARGQDYEGCGCETHPFRCCPDGVSRALGPNYAGCSCETFDYGCCPDGRTPARGSNHEGCGCESTQFGCCHDRNTPASGPNFEGCGCQSSHYGCCQDGHTPARGPNHEGCGCETTYYGCCPDERTPSQGPNNEGCAPVKIMKPGEVCGHPKESGSCRNFTVKWFFDMDYGGCSRFWFGGCEGNDNRFDSQEECQQVCVAPEGTDACHLPKVSGSCDAQILSYYYDSRVGQCNQFYYSGCLGNNNRFETLDKCEETCRKLDMMDPCLQPKAEGPCRGYFVRWYFDHAEARCKQFVYGGCKGNDNSFDSENECIQQCTARSERDVCILPKETGPCRGFFPRWYHDITDSLCKEFTYGGCQGNKNRFVSKDLCEQTCNTTQVGDELCTLPRDQGPCSNYEILWYFDQADGRCRQFYYGGCDGNDNRFRTEEECLGKCPQQHSVAVCTMPQAIGNCFNYAERYFFDTSIGRCRGFIYGGCGGNQNNFYSSEECEHRCGGTAVTAAPRHDEFKTEYCHLDKTSGPCYDDNANTRWYYDKSDGVCKQYLHEGCLANENRFATRKDCDDKCTHSQDVCRLPRITGPCSGSFQQWAYNAELNVCEELLYGGCEGNANRFDSIETCEQYCKRIVELPPTAPAPTTPRPEVDEHEDACRLPQDPGPCAERELRWFHDPADRQCKPFAYGGCQGNRNRFDTLEQCEEVCVSHHIPEEPDTQVPTPSTTSNWTDICILSADPGPCNTLEPRWFYEPTLSTCIPFAYGGCQGNENNFASYEICLSTCATTQPCPDPGDCSALQCPYGPEHHRDWRGCAQCRCADPCREYRCPEKTQCAVEVHSTESGETRAQPFCKHDVKQGDCPVPNSLNYGNGNDKLCEQQCSVDPDCPDSLKCCFNGCSFSCMEPDIRHEPAREPVQPETTSAIPPRIVSSEQEIVTSSGATIQLPCAVHGHPTPQIAWAKGHNYVHVGHERYSMTSDGTLTIEDVNLSDEGDFVCIAINEAGTSEKAVRLIVQESETLPHYVGTAVTPSPRPAAILGGVRVVVTPLQEPCHLNCNADGWPNPAVTWWRDTQMLPRVSEKYQQFGNYTLLIRTVTATDVGPYQCRAYNGIGQVAVWETTIYANSSAPAILEDPKYLKYFGKAADYEGGDIPTNPDYYSHHNPNPNENRNWKPENEQTYPSHREIPTNGQPQTGHHEQTHPTHHEHPSRGQQYPTHREHPTHHEQPSHGQQYPTHHEQPSHGQQYPTYHEQPSHGQQYPTHHEQPSHGQQYPTHHEQPQPTHHEQTHHHDQTHHAQTHPPNHEQPHYAQSQPTHHEQTYPTHHEQPYHGQVHPSRHGQPPEQPSHPYSPNRNPYQHSNEINPNTLHPQSMPEATNPEWPVHQPHQPESVTPPRGTEDVAARIATESTKVESNTPLQLDCFTTGSAQIKWYKDDVEIHADNRTVIMSNGTLIIKQARPDDSGTFKCEASSHYNRAESSVTITVNGMYIPAYCTDNSHFANCQLIVKAKYCNNRYYARFCCRSCTLSGQITPDATDLNEDNDNLV